jgi:hypothetical protein
MGAGALEDLAKSRKLVAAAAMAGQKAMQVRVCVLCVCFQGLHLLFLTLLSSPSSPRSFHRARGAS